MTRSVLTLSVAALLVFAACEHPETALEKAPAATVADIARTQLTSGPSTDQFIEFSPDGRQIAFVSDRDGAQRLWRTPVQGGEATPLTAGQGAF